MSSIRINQNMAQIGIETQKAVVEIRSSQPRMTIKHTPARFKLHRRMPQFKVKQDDSLIGTGNKTSSGLALQRFYKAKRMTLEAIGRIAAEGDALMRIENGGNGISDIATKNFMDNVEVKFEARPKVELEWDKGQNELEWSPHDIEIVWDMPDSPQISVTPHKIRVYLKKRNFIDIDVVNDEKNKNKGIKVDKRV